MANPTTGKYSIKPYTCLSCGREEEHGTNHWGEIYPHCRTCRQQTAWECGEPIPDGYDMPAKWAMMTLGDVCEIVESAEEPDVTRH